MLAGRCRVHTRNKDADSHNEQGDLHGQQLYGLSGMAIY
jgi:hypothetical protein